MADIVPTVVPESYEDIVRVFEEYASFAKTIHVDVADGKFAPNTTWMPTDEKLPQGMEWEIHMMVENPHDMGLRYVAAGATSLIGHVEAFKSAGHAADAFTAWKGRGAKTVAAAALLQTSLETVEPYAAYSNWILLMTIASIGVQGIPFEESGIGRIAQFHEKIPNTIIGVDGGVSGSNIERLAKAGASHFCVGSAISKAADPKVMYQHLVKLAGNV
jgi:ribulose-phosphate 3-epimerase